jgi:hypothetical protein
VLESNEFALVLGHIGKGNRQIVQSPLVALWIDDRRQVPPAPGRPFCRRVERYGAHGADHQAQNGVLDPELEVAKEGWRVHDGAFTGPGGLR